MRLSTYFICAAAVLTTGVASAIGNDPVITIATIDAATKQISIQGSGFGSALPQVTLSQFPLQVMNYTDTAVVAVLPNNLAPGSYLLSLTRGSPPAKNGEFTVAIVGSTPGPQGPAGDTGPAGASGPAGPAGAAGAAGPAGPAGAVGSAGAVGAAGPTGLSGATGAAGPAGFQGGQGPAGPQGVTGTSPYTFQTASNKRQLVCSDINGCTYSNEIVVATAPQGYVRVALLYCITPQITTVSATTYIPPYIESDIGCAYSGTLTRGQLLTIGATIMIVAGAPTQSPQP